MTASTKRVLVTGGAGFLGSHLCERLINYEYDDVYKGLSAGSNPTGKMNENVKKYVLWKQ